MKARWAESDELVFREDVDDLGLPGNVRMAFRRCLDFIGLEAEINLFKRDRVLVKKLK